MWKKGFFYSPASSIENGDSSNTSNWELFNHSGTHIDFPFHFYKGGQTINDFPVDFWIFKKEKIQVIEIDLDGDLLIKPEQIKNNNINFNSELILIKTVYSKYRNEEKYWKYNPGLSMEFVEWIREKFTNLKVVGLDSISVSSWQHRDIGRKVHKKLLDPCDPILIIEDMDLSKIDKNTNFKNIVIAPLMVEGADGSPCTILAELV